MDRDFRQGGLSDSLVRGIGTIRNLYIIVIEGFHGHTSVTKFADCGR